MSSGCGPNTSRSIGVIEPFQERTSLVRESACLAALGIRGVRDGSRTTIGFHAELRAWPVAVRDHRQIGALHRHARRSGIARVAASEAAASLVEVSNVER